MLIILFASSVSANTKLVNSDKVVSSPNVYVISNRVTALIDNELVTINKVKSNTGLDFIKANLNSNDSLNIEKLDSVDFLSEISLLKGNWLVFVHGDAKTLEQSILRGLKIQKLYNINVIVFSWPSRDLSIHGIKNFKISQSHVAESLGHFVKVLEFVHLFREKNPSFLKEQKISLFFHSLGNLYMKKFIENDLQKSFPDRLFDNIILNAAAVNQKNHKEWVEKLNMQNHIFIISNKHDFNLKGARIFTSDGKQLGEKIKLPLASNASYINFDKAIGFRFPTGYTHTYFIGEMATENIKEFYSTIFHGGNPNFKDENTFKIRRDNIGYEIILQK